MDVRAHLRGLGWQGEGHSLGKHGGGLKKPLLITHKTGLHGLGAKSQKEKQADQWWLNAFDNALKEMGTGKESSLTKIKDNGTGRGGLYGYFVRGQALEGTIETDSNTTGTSTPTDTHRSTTTTVIISVRDLNGTSDSSSPKEVKQRKKEKKEKKGHKKRKHDEDPVDSHQDEPQTSVKKDSVTASEATDSNVAKKSKKKRKRDAEPPIESQQQPEETVEIEPETISEELSSEERKMQREERRKAKAERRARKEEKRRKKDADESSTTEEPQKKRKSKKEKGKVKQQDGE